MRANHRVCLVAVIVCFLLGGWSLVEAQELPMDQFSMWRYQSYKKVSLENDVLREFAFVVFDKEADDERLKALLEKYSLEPELSGLQADQPDVHQYLFVEDSDRFLGRGRLLAFTDERSVPSTNDQLIALLAALGDEEIVTFVSPVFERDERRFALSPYALVTWSHTLPVGEVSQALHHLAHLVVVRPPQANDSAVLARLEEGYHNILVAMLKIDENKDLFDINPENTRPVVVWLTPPLQLEWKVLPENVSEATMPPSTLSGAPLVFRMWMTLASGVSLPSDQFEVGGSFWEQISIQAWKDEETLVSLPKDAVFSYGYGPTEIGTIDIERTPQSDGSTTMVITIPMKIRTTGEHWLDKLSFRVGDLNPLTEKMREFTVEYYYDEPMIITPLLDADAKDGGGVSGFVVVSIPATIAAAPLPRLLFVVSGFLVVLLVGVALRERRRREEESVVVETRRDRALRAMDTLLKDIRSTSSDEEFWAKVRDDLVPFVGTYCFEESDPHILSRGRANIRKTLRESFLTENLQRDLAMLLEDARNLLLGGSPTVTPEQGIAVVERLQEELRR